MSEVCRFRVDPLVLVGMMSCQTCGNPVERVFDICRVCGWEQDPWVEQEKGWSYANGCDVWEARERWATRFLRLASLFEVTGGVPTPFTTTAYAILKPEEPL